MQTAIPADGIYQGARADIESAPTVCGMVQKLDAINSPIIYVFLSSNFLHKNL